MSKKEAQIVNFWLLDINYEMLDNIPEIRLWGITEKNERIVVLDRSFRPYFYAVLNENVKVEEIKERIQKNELVKKHMISIVPLEKKFFGQHVKVLKITCYEPPVIPKIRNEIRRIKGIRDVLEADIRFYMRYMIDNDIHPCSWHEVIAYEVPNTRNWQVDRVFLAASTPKVKQQQKPPPSLSIYAFDIECYNIHGEPLAERDPIIIVSRVHNKVKKDIFMAQDKNDKNLLIDFVKDIKNLDPDIIVGYNSNRFDLPYLIERSKRNRIKFGISRSNSKPSQSVYGHFSIIGRANVDLYDFAEEIYEVKIKTLENIADYLGVFPKNERTRINKNEIFKYWDDRQKRETLIKYSLEDAESTYGIAEKILPFAIQLSSIVGLPLDQIGSASVGYRVEWYLMRQAYKYDELIPNRIEKAYETYKGAIVLEPKPGIHENIAVLDFSSMYPNIMIKMNISPDTYVPPNMEIDTTEVYITPEVGHRFRKEPPGLYKKVLQKLLDARNQIRKEMKNLDPDSIQYRLLNERQRALKIIANATYGYCGWIGARWYKREVAEATTAWGRALIKKAITLARKLGLEVIYGDTDSLFIRYDDKVKEFIEMIQKELGFEIKIDKIYKRVFFTEAKKRYCGLTEDDRIDVVGLEAVRGDWSELAKEVQEKVIEIILKEADPNKAVKYVREIINELKNGNIPLEKLVIWKTLSKRIEDYEIDAAHVRVAKMLMKSGYKVSKGEKIGYIICKGSGEKLSERVKPYMFVKNYDEIDIDYYINKQIIPVALRVLKFFKISEQQLMKGEKQTSILEFFN